MDTPLISIIIPSYNYGHFIAETLNSIVSQTYSNWEVIIVDDGSVDNSQEIVQNFCTADKRFIWILKKNGGVSTARNVGIKAASGKFIQFLDADDLISPDKLQIQVDYLIKHEKIDIIFSDGLFFDELGYMKPAPAPYLNSSAFNNICELSHQNLLISAPIFRKRILLTDTPFPQNIRYNEDWEFWLELALKNNVFHYLKDERCFTSIRVHSMNSSINRNTMLVAELEMKKRLLTNIKLQQLFSILEIKKIERLLRKRISNIYKELMFGGSLLNLSWIKKNYSTFGILNFLKYYLKAINNKRK
ncbi:glycosyltransferase [Pedobacter sandarakinus]|uniref:glycosyltransferase n=1 Tax=Pedobacter sandarakinus TaxID=353156 RepID=UPI002246276B|nr:glycosyltransferase [Pedobacter sandarakinus]MCX2573428.1 glycosyltransferase [Pedobacter sandarakinus]